jgi:plastocyanin
LKLKHWLLVAIVIIIFAGFFNSRLGAPLQNIKETEVEEASESGAMEDKKGMTVTFTESGFSPEKLKVTKGTTVTFINESSGMMWVASDSHPVHGDLSEFDQLRSSGKGSTYAFTFNEFGEWSYHNHLAPDNKGVIIVE